MCLYLEEPNLIRNEASMNCYISGVSHKCSHFMSILKQFLWCGNMHCSTRGTMSPECSNAVGGCAWSGQMVCVKWHPHKCQYPGHQAKHCTVAKCSMLFTLTVVLMLRLILSVYVCYYSPCICSTIFQY